jgi:hypothetical protein
VNRRLLAAGRVAPANPSLVPPIRGAFYFPWYDELWNQLGHEPFTIYTPTLGYYDQKDIAVLEQHMEWAAAANIDVLIPTWQGEPDGSGPSISFFGAGYMDTKIGTMLGLALQHGIKIAVLYEIEAYGDPTAAEIEAEFDYLAQRYFRHPAYCHVDGRPVIFVYSGQDATDALLAKYSTASASFTTAYVVMQTASVTSTTPQPDGWYMFSANREAEIGNSFTILPGFDRIDDVGPVVARDLSTWETNIANMVASGKDWQLIISFNEWGEGSSIEPAEEYGTDYLDALA